MHGLILAACYMPTFVGGCMCSTVENGEEELSSAFRRFGHLTGY